MNSLNSVLIEGVIIEAAHTTADNRCLFSMLATRDEPDAMNGGSIHFDIPLEVEVKNWRLAIACINNLPAGRGLRVVGRLHGEALSVGSGFERYALWVIAEHVEFKPIQKRPQPVNHSANSDAEYMGDHDSGL
jgi:single-strand DNA-binding protein